MPISRLNRSRGSTYVVGSVSPCAIESLIVSGGQPTWTGPTVVLT